MENKPEAGKTRIKQLFLGAFGVGLFSGAYPIFFHYPSLRFYLCSAIIGTILITIVCMNERKKDSPN
jgi:hypothetical protein